MSSNPNRVHARRLVSKPTRALSFLTALVLPLVIGSVAAAQPAPAPYAGPKKTIAVAPFDANGAFRARYGDWEIGGGLAAQLATELSKSNHFLLVERAELDMVLQEQELGQAGLTQRRTAPQKGNLIGAQLLIRGSVTEFNEKDKGGGFSLGGGITGSLAAAVSPRMHRGHVSIDFRVIDTTTGRIVATHTSRAETSRMGLGVAGIGSRVSFSADAFKRTALGEATREAITDAVRFIEGSMSQVAWSARVAKVRGDQVYLTAGANANLTPGTALFVYQVADSVVDPLTGEVLGMEEIRVGTVRLEQVESRYARGRFTGTLVPQPGDVVRFQPGVSTPPTTAAAAY